MRIHLRISIQQYHKNNYCMSILKMKYPNHKIIYTAQSKHASTDLQVSGQKNIEGHYLIQIYHMKSLWNIAKTIRCTPITKIKRQTYDSMKWETTLIHHHDVHLQLAAMKIYLSNVSDIFILITLLIGMVMFYNVNKTIIYLSKIEQDKYPQINKYIDTW